jgi:RimJ/RimL family protein N-acetyltransferase
MTPPATTIPRVDTERLLLREWRLGDFDGYANEMADPLARVHMAGVVDRRAAWRFFVAGAGMWMLLGTGWWAIELRATRECVGMVGIFYRETQLDHMTTADLEIGWTIYRPHWRRGFATEAARAALRFGFERLSPPRVIAHVSPDNSASIGVARAIGMTFDAETDFYGEPSHRYALPNVRRS